MPGNRPQISVVIPTYNRSELLRETLRALTAQRIPATDFEVVVADDGSSDETKAVVESFFGELQLKYYYQDDRGFRAGRARNAGARLSTAPILVFIDTGDVPGPDFLGHHLAAHAGPDTSGAHRAVIGYVYGYSEKGPVPGLREALDRMTPEEVVAHYAGDDDFLDIRHQEFVKCDFRVSDRAVPWILFWSTNCSVLAEDFWAAGGFDDDLFHHWGMEDMELGFRLTRRGLPVHLVREAWVVEAPHERDWERNWAEVRQNIPLVLAAHPEPLFEIGYTLMMDFVLWDWEEEYQALLDHAERVRDRDVAGELEEAARSVPATDRVAVLGVGGKVPPALQHAVVLDFDKDLLDQAVTGGATGVHGLGLRTPLADQSVDTVVITSRMDGLWPRWGETILAEARRIGRTVLRSGG